MSGRDRDLVVVGGLWVVLSVAGELLADAALRRWPIVVTEQGGITTDAFAFLLRVGVVIFVLVALLIAYSAIRFRAREEHPTDQAGSAPVQRRGYRAFTLGWVAITTALNVVFIVYPGAVGLGDLARLERAAEAGDPVVVEVGARQWGWSYGYPSLGVEAATELALPVGRPAKLLLTSSDVIHSFWVPAFGIKKDIVPGQTTVLYLTPTTIASTEVDPRMRAQCAELCGVGHAEMRSAVRILSEADFARWIAAQQPGPSGGPGGSMAPMSMAPGGSMAPGDSIAPAQSMAPMPGMSMAP